jgi:hypothetical protein
VLYREGLTRKDALTRLRTESTEGSPVRSILSFLEESER